MRKCLHLLAFMSVLGGIAVIGSGATVFAQEEQADSFMLEEISVTAQKRAENQQKVAIAMDVVSGEEISGLGKNSIDEILNNISSVLINQADDGLRVSIRGMSNDNAPFGNMQVSTPTVAVNKDGVYTNRNAGNTDLFDVERVEVLFGPQSTLYASASPGGIVNIVTANPKLDAYSASGSIEYGNYDLLKTEASMNVPVSSTMALRGAFSTTIRDGYLTNGGMDEDSKAARLRYLYQPSDIFSVVLTGELSKTGGQGFASVEQFSKQDDVENPWTATSDTPGNANVQDREKLYANADLEIGDIGTLSIIGSYSETTNDRTGTQAVDPDGPGPAEAEERKVVDSGSGDEYGIEARMVSSEDAPFKWLLGVNFYETSDNQSSFQYEQGADADDEADNIGIRWNEQTTWAVYGNITYPLTERFRATAGLRQTWDENESYNYQFPGKPPFQDEPTIEGTYMEYDDPNYKVGFEFDIGVNSMLYGDWSTSYRTQSAGTKGAEFAPEELSAYSLGAKNRFFDNRLQFNVATYYYDYENYFAVVGPMMTIVDANNNGIRDYDDANGNGQWDEGEEWLENDQVEDLGNLTTGDARIYGVDIQTTTLITDRDKLDLSISYIKKEFTDLLFDYYDITNDMGLEDLDYSGKEMPNAPNWTVNANYSHIFSLPNGGTITPRFEGRYSSKYVLNFQAYEVGLSEDQETGQRTAFINDTSDVRWQEAYYIADVSIGYNHSDGNWTLTGYVKNIGDYAVKRGMMMGSFQIGPPRTYGAVLSMRF
jgi:iron complex outermembrane receptor protein